MFSLAMFDALSRDVFSFFDGKDFDIAPALQALVWQILLELSDTLVSRGNDECCEIDASTDIGVELGTSGQPCSGVGTFCSSASLRCSSRFCWGWMRSVTLLDVMVSLLRLVLLSLTFRYDV